MRHLKQLQLESKELEVFEVASLLRGFLEDKGIKANVEKFESFFNIYISGYANEESPKRVPVQKLLSYFKSLDICEDATIQKTKFGYTIEMLKDGQSEKLMEAVAEEDEGHKCFICEKTYFGYGNDPWPITTEPGERVCDQCNTEYVIPARLELLLGKNKKPRREAVDKASVEHAASNLILDNKYIWLFSVLDVDGEDIEEGIEYLQDAIDSLVANNGTFLVAFPYVDPKPEDESVELVFADNPGPVVIYNREASTVAKGKLDRPSQERKSKGESVIEESLDSLVLEGLNNGDVLVVIEDNSNHRDIEEALSIAKEIVGPSYEWMRVQDYNIKYITMGIRESSAMVNGVINLLNKEFKNRGLDVEAYSHWITQERKSKGESIKEAGQQAPTEQQKAVQGINDVANYLKKHKEAMSGKDLETLVNYCRILLKAINKVAEVKTESMAGYGFKSLKGDAWELYNKASKYFPDEPDALSDEEADAFVKSAIEYIMINFTEDEIYDIVDGDNEQLYEVAEDIYDKALFYITDYLRESKNNKLSNKGDDK